MAYAVEFCAGYFRIVAAMRPARQRLFFEAIFIRAVPPDDLRAIKQVCGRRRTYAVDTLRGFFSGASRIIPSLFPRYRFTEIPRSALRA